MSNSTVQRPPRRPGAATPAKPTTAAKTAPKAPTSANSAKAARAQSAATRMRVKQTGRIEGRRDGKPLIFGWGRHLTRAQKVHYQRLWTWGFIGLVVVAVVGVLGFGVLNQNVLIPNKTIVSVNGTNISQDTYRKSLAYQAQGQWNILQSLIAQKNALAQKVAAGDPTATAQDGLITTQLQTAESNYAQAQITQTAANTLVEDQLIREGAAQFEQVNHVPASTFEPSAAEINSALASFKKAFPAGETYAQFLSANGLSESDVRGMVAMQVRRAKMQTYLANRLVSPTRQVHIRKIEVDTAAHAATIRAELVKGGLTDAVWTDLAKKNTLDPNSKDNGGDLGFVAPGTGDGAIETWAYAAGRKVGDLSPVIKDTSGTFDVVQVLGINPSLAVDPTTLSNAKSIALSHWLDQQRANTANKIGNPDSTMLNDTRNLPKTPSLTAALPTITAPPNSGLPGSSVGGSGLPSGTGLGG